MFKFNVLLALGVFAIVLSSAQAVDDSMEVYKTMGTVSLKYISDFLSASGGLGSNCNAANLETIKQSLTDSTNYFIDHAFSSRTAEDINLNAQLITRGQLAKLNIDIPALPYKTCTYQ